MYCSTMRLPMKPSHTPDHRGLPDPLRQAHDRARTSLADLPRARPRGASFTLAGLKSACTARPWGPPVNSAILFNVQRGRVGRENGAGLHRLSNRLNTVLDRDVLETPLDHHVGVFRCRRRGSARGRHALLELLRAEPSFSSRSLRSSCGCRKPLSSASCFISSKVTGMPALRIHRDAHAHGPRADDRHFLDLQRRVLRQSGIFAARAPEESMPQRRAIAASA